MFARLGFDAEPFGGTAIIVRGVPTPHPRFDAERCLRDTLAALTGDRVAGVAARHERLAATFACKAAIKAGEPLAQDTAPTQALGEDAQLEALARRQLRQGQIDTWEFCYTELRELERRGVLDGLAA